MEIKTVPIESLSVDPANARRHPIKNLEAIKGSLRRFGQRKNIVVDKNNVVRAGNGALEAARALGWAEITVSVMDASETELTAFAIADNRTGELAEWDTAVLGEVLESLQFEGIDLADIGFSSEDLDKLSFTGAGQDLSDEEREELYSQKIESPIYTPKGEKPDVCELYDQTKTAELLQEIDAAEADIPPEVNDFLSVAAQRHTVFDYGKIAEYYAHAPARIQELMEKSALIIIDFKKAIELGFVEMTKEIAEAYHNERV